MCGRVYDMCHLLRQLRVSMLSESDIQQYEKQRCKNAHALTRVDAHVHDHARPSTPTRKHNPTGIIMQAHTHTSTSTSTSEKTSTRTHKHKHKHAGAQARTHTSTQAHVSSSYISTVSANRGCDKSAAYALTRSLHWLCEMLVAMCASFTRCKACASMGNKPPIKRAITFFNKYLY